VSAAQTTTAGRGIRVERGAKRVRAYLAGTAVADTIRPLLVWEVPYYPTYYFPAEDVRDDLLHGYGGGEAPNSDGELLTVRVGEREAPGSAIRFDETASNKRLRGTVRLEWSAMDAWFEEDEEVFTHARDPHSRIDILASSRHVRVEVAGEVVAESTSPRLLFETGLPARYYLPKPHVRLNLLEPSETVTQCPYKGRAETFSVRAGGRLHSDLAWSYPAPLPESQKIAGLIAFYSEKVDLFVDGAREERPHTPFS
jgi:uncharacterized protein (DUF427 family)